MISKHDILEMAKHIARKDRGRADRSLMHPAREWSVALTVTLVLGVGGCWWAGLSYLSYQDLLDQETEGYVETVGLKEELVDAALDKYADKRREYERLKVAGVTNVASVPSAGQTASTTEATIEEVGEDVAATTLPVVVEPEPDLEVTASSTPATTE